MWRAGLYWFTGIHLYLRLLTCLICCLVAVPGWAGDELWEWVTPLPQGHGLGAAASGNGVTVAVGREGTAIASTDGVEWWVTHSDDSYGLSDVVWVDGLFVAVGGSGGYGGVPGLAVVLSSTDGFTWVERYRAEYLTLGAVAWTDSRFVAVGSGSRVLLSDDGFSWSEHDLESGIWWEMHDIAWNGSTLVAIGGDNHWPYGLPSFFVSEDGEAWSVQNIECEHCHPASIAAVEGRFVVVGPSRKALVSDDGLTWTEAPYDSTTDLEVIVGAGDRFLAIGHDIVGSSLDGYSWSVEDLPTESKVWGLAWGGDGFLAVGEDGFVMSSPDGSEWTQLSTKSFDAGGTREINELATNGPTIVGVGDVVVTGRHGTEWTRRYLPVPSTLYGVIWNGSAFWAAGDYGVFKSIDGVHWTQPLLDNDVTLFDIVWNGSLFVAVGRSSTFVDAVVETREVVLTSPDGHDWSYLYFDIEGHLFAVGWASSRFVAMGSGTQYFTSTDGTVWQPHDQEEGVTIKDMVWNGERLVAVGGRYDNGGLILLTDKGIGWVESPLPEAAFARFGDVTWTGTHFVAVSRSSGDAVFTSTDGLWWEVESTATGLAPVSVVGDDRSLYVTGRGLKIIRRTEPLKAPEPPRRPGRRVLPDTTDRGRYSRECPTRR